MKNFYDLLAGRNAAEHSFSKRSFFNTPNKSFGDLKIDISFEQSQPHMAQCGIDVRFADRAMTTQLFENVLKFVRKLGKHDDKKLNIAPRHFPGGASVSHAGELIRAIARNYFLGVGTGKVVPPALPSSIPKVQCASTFFP